MEKKIYKCFVASPSDTENERGICKKVLAEINKGQEFFEVKTIMWEDMYSGIAGSTQEVIDKQVGDYDLFIGIMSQKFGKPIPTAITPTVREYVRAVGRYESGEVEGVMFYFYAKESGELGEDEESIQFFKEGVDGLGGVGERMLYKEYDNYSDFEKQIRENLNKFFEDRADKTKKFAKQLTGRVAEQKQEILKKRLTGANGLWGFSVEELLNKIYIEPSTKELQLGKGEELHKKVIELNDAKVLLMGAGGVGKTTLLAKIYCELAEQNVLCPIYFDLNGQKLRKFSMQEIIEGKESNIHFNYFDSDRYRYVILIDGLDEAQPLEDGDWENFLQSEFFTQNQKVILAGREEFVQNYSEISEGFYQITVKDYGDNFEKQIEFLTKFCCRESIEINFDKQEVEKIMKENPDTLKNPLLLSMFLTNAQDKDYVQGGEIKAYQIVEDYINGAINRELRRGEHRSEKIKVSDIVKELSIAHWKIYYNRSCSENKNRDTLYDDVTHCADESITDADAVLLNTCLGFFTSRYDHRYEKIKSNNEVILDYFCAKYMHYVLIGEITDGLDPLSVDHLKVEIKRHCFNDFMDKSQKKMAFKHLVKSYKQLNCKADYLKILHIVNFFPHIKEENKIGLVKFLLWEKFVNFLTFKGVYDVKRNVINHCVLQAGKYFPVIMPILEKMYYRKMLKNPKFDAFMRGAYLVYYDQSLPTIHEYPYLDGANGRYPSWDRVFEKGLKEHIEEGERRYPVRRIEFRIAKQFIETRKSVSRKIADFYINLEEQNPTAYNFSKNAEKEYWSLIDTIRRYAPR